jgi:ethylmalonyl-CoA mutase
VEEVLARLEDAGLDVPVVVGGIIPIEDGEALKRAGVAAVYTPKDFRLNDVVGDLAAIVERRLEEKVELS